MDHEPQDPNDPILPKRRSADPLGELVELVEAWPKAADDCAIAIVHYAERTDDRGETLADVALGSAAMLEMLDHFLGATRKAALAGDSRRVLALLEALDLVTPSPRSWLLEPGRRPLWSAFFARISQLHCEILIDTGRLGVPRGMPLVPRTGAPVPILAPHLQVIRGDDEGAP